MSDINFPLIMTAALLATASPGPSTLAIAGTAMAHGRTQALALVAQTWAQAHLAPTRAAIVMSMEPVFAATFAVGLGGESLTWRLLGGGAMVLVAMLVVEAGPRRPIEGEVQHLAV